MLQLTSKQLRRAAALKDKIENLQVEFGRIMGGGIILGNFAAAPKKRKLTAAGRERISQAVKARWVREKAAKK